MPKPFSPSDGCDRHEELLAVTEEQITAYAAGWLEPDEAARVQQAVAEDPRLLAVLDQAIRVRNLLEEDPDVDPPERLLHRTIATVYMRNAAERCGMQPVATLATYARQRWLGMRLIDMAVCAVLALVVSMLLFPALARVREYQREVVCRENLRAIGLAMGVYADQFHGALPQVSWSEGLGPPAAIQPVMLAEHGYLTNIQALRCPGDHAGVAEATPHSLQQLAQARRRGERQRLVELLRDASGSYAFSTGYFVDGLYHSPSLSAPTGGTGFQVIVADRPDTDFSGGWVPSRNSANHGSRGQNVLYADLHVAFLPSPQAPGSHDPIYVNRADRLGAALAWDDVALAPGDVLPEGPIAFAPRDRHVF